MGFLQRIFGGGDQPVADAAAFSAGTDAGADVGATDIPPERVGLNGEYDQSGLAKRVAKAFDDSSSLTDVETLWVAQLSGTVVLKGKVPTQEMLDQFVAIASGVSGATSVDTAQVEIG
ncbi:phospholipid-binding protein [Leptolyngbya sp. 'hensonii']|uniref:BON domain-containing protein n=1 Tax=Leptolyngbya sp. 'hensonii' TaxID=1922337 RepID=UPI00094F5CF0|nr:BON domain-containing protein [Leptolyngbya sp. 'hensonii']OLP16766.1 phospholipid-binding protein [Leptolyngbya sp. 'hensonii']